MEQTKEQVLGGSMRLEEMEFLPDNSMLDHGIMYFSAKYQVAKHICVCGCGEVSATPMVEQFGQEKHDKNAWIIIDKYPLTIDASFHHRFNCRSHYSIKKGYIVWN